MVLIYCTPFYYQCFNNSLIIKNPVLSRFLPSAGIESDFKRCLQLLSPPTKEEKNGRAEKRVRKLPRI